MLYPKSCYNEPCYKEVVVCLGRVMQKKGTRGKLEWNRTSAWSSKVPHHSHEPAHNKTYYSTWVTSKDSDQPVQKRRLIWVFVGFIIMLQRERWKLDILGGCAGRPESLLVAWVLYCYCRFCRVLVLCWWHGCYTVIVGFVVCWFFAGGMGVILLL